MKLNNWLRWATVLALGVAAFWGVSKFLTFAPASIVKEGVAGSEVKFVPARLVLGAYPWGVEVPFEFEFYNGGAPITVGGVDSSCDCVLTSGGRFEGSVVASGTSILIEGSIDAGRHPGKLVRTLTLRSVTGEEWSAVIEIDVVGTWTLSSDRIDFGKIELGQPLVQPIEAAFTFSSDSDNLLGEPTSSVPWLQIFLAERGPNESEILLRVDPRNLQPGIHTADVQFRTSSDARPDGVVYVRLEAVPALDLRPSQVFLLGGETRAIRVFDSAGAVAKIASVRSTNDQLIVRIIQPNGVEVQSDTKIDEIVDVTIVDSKKRSAVLRVSVF